MQYTVNKCVLYNVCLFRWLLKLCKVKSDIDIVYIYTSTKNHTHLV